MADRQSTHVRETLKSLFPDRWIQEAARDTDFVQRQRKISPVAFFWTLVLGFGVGSERNISILRRAFERTAGVRVVPSSFYARFNERLVALLRAAADRALEQFQLATGELSARFERLRDVVIVDATIVKLHDALSKTFPGCRTNSAPAALKLHTVLSVEGGGKSTVKLSSARVHDRRKLGIGDWVDGRLLLFDLGYYHFQLFKNIVRRGGHFLTRAKQNANPKIVRVLGGSAVDNSRLRGKRLQDILRGLRREVLDVEVELRANARRRSGRQSSSVERCRLVAVRDTEKREYHCYITSLSVESFSADDIASTYRARWEIELVFKELKSGYRLDEVGSRKRVVVESLIYAAIVTLLVSRALLRAILTRSRVPPARAASGRWWRIFAEYAQELQRLVIRAPREAQPLGDLVRAMEHELVDPHRKRCPLLASTL